jgi:hydroxymethylbilane synthase
MNIRIGTRSSRLALAQAAEVAAAIRALGAGADIVPIRTSGDRLAQVSLADFGGKAMFVKEIEEAILAAEVDVGVHSLKDLPATLPHGLCIAACLRREDPADVLVSRGPGGLEGLAVGAAVGTSSPRRQVLLRHARPDLRIEPIRGNVETRLSKLDTGAYDGLVLARAGLNRLALAPAHLWPLSPETFVPAVGQGILAVEARDDGGPILELLRGVEHTGTRREADAERAFLARLGAGCHTPVAGWAHIDGDQLTVIGLVASEDGATLLRDSVSGPLDAPASTGRRLAEALLARGAAALLRDDPEARPGYVSVRV